MSQPSPNSIPSSRNNTAASSCVYAVLYTLSSYIIYCYTLFSPLRTHSALLLSLATSLSLHSSLVSLSLLCLFFSFCSLLFLLSSLSPTLSSLSPLLFSFSLSSLPLSLSHSSLSPLSYPLLSLTSPCKLDTVRCARHAQGSEIGRATRAIEDATAWVCHAHRKRCRRDACPAIPSRVQWARSAAACEAATRRPHRR